jgi:hypothetical protein
MYLGSDNDLRYILDFFPLFLIVLIPSCLTFKLALQYLCYETVFDWAYRIVGGGEVYFG